MQRRNRSALCRPAAAAAAAALCSEAGGGGRHTMRRCLPGARTAFLGARWSQEALRGAREGGAPARGHCAARPAGAAPRLLGLRPLLERRRRPGFWRAVLAGHTACVSVAFLQGLRGVGAAWSTRRRLSQAYCACRAHRLRVCGLSHGPGRALMCRQECMCQCRSSCIVQETGPAPHRGRSHPPCGARGNTAAPLQYRGAQGRRPCCWPLVVRHSRAAAPRRVLASVSAWLAGRTEAGCCQRHAAAGQARAGDHARAGAA